MESAPLIKAHDHAREASIATHTADTVVAVTEHALAAGEFATAASSTSSIEALRTLRLLEQHHARLARLLRHSLAQSTLQQQQQQQPQSTADGETLNEKDAALAEPRGPGLQTGAGERAEAGAGAGAGAGVRTGVPAGATTLVSGVVSRGEFARSGPVIGHEGEPAAVAASGGGGDGTKGAVMMAGTLDPSPSATTAAAHHAGAAAMANLLPIGQQQQQQQQQRRYPSSRELSSSIANNLASARGIRAQNQHRGLPAAPSMSNDQAPGSLEAQVRQDGGSRAQMQTVLQQQQQQQASGKPSWVPPKHPPASLSAQPPTSATITDADTDGETSATKADDGFARFYNRFGSIINRLSAPLAFAGLPLITEESTASNDSAASAASDDARQQSPPRHQRQRRNTHLRASSQLAGAEPDLSQIYSKAALRALGRDGHSLANDSFYVVPKTGHTASYANILSFDQKEKRRMAASLHGGGVDHDRSSRAADSDHDHEMFLDGDDDDFVDAKESQPPRKPESPTRSRRTGGGGNRMHRWSIGGGSSNSNNNNSDAHRAAEELYTENQSLKDMLDKLSRRLHAFEASAQQSHMALQESMRFMRPGSPSSLSGSGKPGLAAAATAATAATAPAAAAPPPAELDALMQKNKHLEEELAAVVQRLEASERERAHQEKTLAKYRDKWEKLKAGAKARREAQGGPSDGGSPTPR